MLFNGHMETIFPAMFRKVSGVEFERERIKTPDDDFIDLDWSRINSNKLAIICHGLEGDSQRPYMKGMTKAVNKLLNYDAVAFNFRGCSGEINLQSRFYHSGATDDLEVVVNHALLKGYDSISLIGFSLGGNLVLKYLGEIGKDPTKKISSAVTFSVPLHLESSSYRLMKWFNYGYSQRFLKSLKSKIKQKENRMPGNISLEQLDKVRHVFHFDDLFTAPLHGFIDAKDYYTSCSSLFLVDRIRIPTLIINALNDPILSKKCFPFTLLKSNKIVAFEAPQKGGHCGFARFEDDFYWSERRAAEFIKSDIRKSEIFEL